MKLRSVFFAACLVVPLTSLFAGGIVTNTNQSASWTRNPSTAASLGTEAVYYNPAATALLGPGLSVSISNQSIFQKREIENFYSGLNQSLFKGTVNAPVFPSIYAAYNLNKFSFSFGFNPIGGGGSAEFKNGLPSFEVALADMVKTFKTGGATGYSLDAYFKGSSIYFGYQFGVAYKINDNVSVFGGLRYVAAKNTYEGYLKDINLIAGTESYAPATFMTNLAATLNAGATTLNGYAANVGNIATALGSSGITFDDAITLTAGNPTLQGQITAIRNGLTSLGVQNAGSLTLAAGQANFAGYATGYTNSANQITSQIPGAAVLTADQEADVEQTGSGISPIVGINLSLMERKLNVGIKYEFATKMEVENKTSKDVITGFSEGVPVTMFPDGAKIPSDMPALLSVGVSYKLLDKLSVSSSLYYYFDKSVEYGKKLLKDGQPEYVRNDEVIDGNFIDWAMGAEYQLTKKLLVSTGYMFGKQDVKQIFQSDLNYSISSHTYCIGGKYSISPKFDVNLGLSWSKYEKGKKHAKFSKTYDEIALETYMKDTFIVGVGVDIKLSK